VPDLGHAELAPEDAFGGHLVVLSALTRTLRPARGRRSVDRLCRAVLHHGGVQPARTSVGEFVRSGADQWREAIGEPEEPTSFVRRLRARCRLAWIWISMRTPAGRSSRWSDSTVLLVGSTMSSRRLWIRISKCSRESLSTCGDRTTQNRRTSVG